VHVLDTGSGDWWQVDVILRPPPDAGDLSARLPELVSAALPDVEDVPSVAHDPEPAFSFDIPPPEGNLGVALWVRAAGLGAAVDGAWNLVASRMRELGPRQEPQLWDLRVVPLTAVLQEPEAGAAVATLPSQPPRRWWKRR
jgi:hypothetical protein